MFPGSLSHLGGGGVSAGLMVGDDISESRVSSRYEKLACHFLNNAGTAQSAGRLITNGFAVDHKQM